MNISQIRVMLATAIIGFAAGHTNAEVQISQDPLFLVQPVRPAMIMGVDDSGSMDGEMIMPTNDGAMWWHTGNRSFTGLGINADASADVEEPGRLNFNQAGGANGTWKKYVYLFPNGSTGTSGDRRRYSDSTHDHYAVAPLPQYAYARSPEFNSIYFDPAEEYPPFPSAGSETFGDADPTAAEVDPPRGDSVMDLTQPIRSDANNWVFKMHRGMVVPADTVFREVDDCQLLDEDDDEVNVGSWGAFDEDLTVNDADCRLAIEYFPATFWLQATTSLPSGFEFTGTPLVGEGPAGEALLGYEIKPENFDSFSAYDAAIQRFANWFSYYRKRSLLTRAAMGRSFEDVEFLRVGSFEINNRNNVTMIDFDDATARQDFFDEQYNLRGVGGTPNREAVNHMGSQFNRTGDNAPIVEACQRNFGLLVTDGFSNATSVGGVGNEDGDSASPLRDTFLGDGESGTMADIAFRSYNTRLRTDLEAGRVPTPAACNQPNPSLALDCNDDLHMNLFAITLGAKGVTFGVDEDATLDPYTNNPTWPTTFTNRSPTAVDDLWHATLNTRGEMFSATRPGELVDALSSVLSEIAARVQPVGISVSSSRLDESSLFFVADLDSTTWSGELTAFRFNEDTDPDFDSPEVVWRATAPGNIPAAPARTIRTTVDGTDIPFNTGNPQLLERVFGIDSVLGDTEKAEIIAYLRGDQSLELNENGTDGKYRRREARLGDIANSRPAFAGPANEGWARLDPSYLTYLNFKDKDQNASFFPRVVVGANDGMVHVFNAETGSEVFAYIPSVLHSKLPELADPDYTHKFFVDGQIRIADAKLNSGWGTVAIGGLAGGGRGIYALDITAPGSPRVLWEITDADDSDVGHVYDQPIVTRLSNDQWVVIFANGINSDDEEPVLFVADLDSGNIIDKVELGGNQDSPGNGLMSTAALMDPVERTSLARIYAGDLQGNVWRVDFSPSPNPAFGDQPLIDVGRPTAAPPTLAPHPNGGVMVFFGTGKLIELGDRTDIDDIETFWAVRDTGSPINNTNNLAEASISDSPDGRLVTVADGDDTSDGWFLELTSGQNGAGEKVLSRPRVLFGQAIFSTFEPLEDPCDSGGINRVYIIDAVAGNGRFDDRCENCGVAEIGEGAPIDPAIVIRQGSRKVLENPGEGEDGPSQPEGPGEQDAGNVGQWCSLLNLLLPGQGLVQIGRICDGRQVWRRMPIAR